MFRSPLFSPIYDQQIFKYKNDLIIFTDGFKISIYCNCVFYISRLKESKMSNLKSDIWIFTAEALVILKVLRMDKISVLLVLQYRITFLRLYWLLKFAYSNLRRWSLTSVSVGLRSISGYGKLSVRTFWRGHWTMALLVNVIHLGTFLSVCGVWWRKNDRNTKRQDLG